MPNVAAAYLIGAALLCTGLASIFWPGPIAEFIKDAGGESTAFARMPEVRRRVGIRVAGAGAVFVSMLVLSAAANAA
jgi:hypothetical protein